MWDHFYVAERFLKSLHLVKDIIDGGDAAEAAACFNSLNTEINYDGDTVAFPVVQAIIGVSETLVQAQVLPQSSTKPTVHCALPLLQKCYEELDRNARAGVVSTGENRFAIQSMLSRKFAPFTFEHLEAKIRVFGLWLVGCFLDPLFKEMQFISNPSKKQDYLRRAKTLTPSMAAEARRGIWYSEWEIDYFQLCP